MSVLLKLWVVKDLPMGYDPAKNVLQYMEGNFLKNAEMLGSRHGFIVELQTGS